MSIRTGGTASTGIWTGYRNLFCFPDHRQILSEIKDYSFVTDQKTNTTYLSLNTLIGRIKVTFDVPACFSDYFDGTWSFGTGKIVSLKNEWYFHIPVTRKNDTEFDKDHVKHVVGIDRGLRYLMTTYDQNDQTSFYSGEAVCRKRDAFNKVRAELQSKGTKSHKTCIETYFRTREPLDERC